MIKAVILVEREFPDDAEDQDYVEWLMFGLRYAADEDRVTILVGDAAEKVIRAAI